VTQLCQQGALRVVERYVKTLLETGLKRAHSSTPHLVRVCLPMALAELLVGRRLGENLHAEGAANMAITNESVKSKKYENEESSIASFRSIQRKLTFWVCPFRRLTTEARIDCERRATSLRPSHGVSPCATTRSDWHRRRSHPASNRLALLNNRNPVMIPRAQSSTQA
jgi:hypothetical protein